MMSIEVTGPIVPQSCSEGARLSKNGLLPGIHGFDPATWCLCKYL